MIKYSELTNDLQSLHHFCDDKINDLKKCGSATLMYESLDLMQNYMEAKVLIEFILRRLDTLRHKECITNSGNQNALLNAGILDVD